MNLRARLSERVHIEDIREVLHFIQDDERLREEVYQLIFDKTTLFPIRHCGYVRISQRQM